ncbi:hypothetical protein D3C78_1497480 [compost metagenome]
MRLLEVAEVTFHHFTDDNDHSSITAKDELEQFNAFALHVDRKDVAQSVNGVFPSIQSCQIL